jgi:ketosteroid isomerase-like protein
MSRDELKLVAKAVRATNARPKPDFATINELFHPDHVLVPLSSQLEGEEYRGARGYQQFLQEGSATLGSSDAPVSWDADFEGAVDVGNHKVIVVTSTRYRGTASGVEFEQRTWVVMTVRDGRVSRSEVYNDPRKALKAALSEQDAHADPS